MGVSGSLVSNYSHSYTKSGLSGRRLPTYEQSCLGLPTRLPIVGEGSGGGGGPSVDKRVSEQGLSYADWGLPSGARSPTEISARAEAEALWERGTTHRIIPEFEQRSLRDPTTKSYGEY